MSNTKTDRVHGELLREWRESRSMAVSELASLANLSAAQVNQLESGGVHLFYTRAIKESAARKVATLLGGDPVAVIRPGPAETPLPEVSVVDELIELSRKKASADRFASFFSLQLRKVAMGGALLVLALLLATTFAWHLQTRHLSGEGLWGPQALASPTQTPARSGEQQEPQSASGVSTVIRSAGDKLGAGNAQTLANGVVPETSPAPAVVPAGSAKTVKTGLCQSGPADAGSGFPQASKAKGVIYVVAQKEGSVCVIDGIGQQTVLSLKMNEAKSVYGPSPWRVHFEHSEQVQLYFQGMRVRLPDAQTTAVLMQEGNPSP